VTREEAIDAAVRRVWNQSPARHKFLAAYTGNPRGRYPESSLLWLITFVDLVHDEFRELTTRESARNVPSRTLATANAESQT
jgi:hypothetical protein